MFKIFNVRQDSEQPLDAATQCLTACYTDCTRIKQMTKAVEEMRIREVKTNTLIAELEGRVRELEAVSINQCNQRMFENGFFVRKLHYVL
jgi:hypothetical protein